MKGNRKIFQVNTEEIDLTTGQVVSYKQSTTYINKNPESFGMYRSTDGLEWAKEFKNYLLFLLVMNEYSDPRTGIVTLSPYKRKEICEFFGYENRNSLSNTILNVIKAGGIVRVNGSNSDFMVNPMCFYKGSTKDFKERYDRYENYRKFEK